MWLIKNKDKYAVNLKQEMNKILAEKKELVEEVLKNKSIASKLKEEIEELKAQKKREMQEVEHLVKMAKEKNEIEFEKKIAKIEVEKQQAISKIKIDALEEQRKEMKEIHREILNRLPNVNMSIKQTRKDD